MGTRAKWTITGKHEMFVCLCEVLYVCHCMLIALDPLKSAYKETYKITKNI